jgi:hypothetical protein
MDGRQNWQKMRNPMAARMLGRISVKGLVDPVSFAQLAARRK